MSQGENQCGVADHAALAGPGIINTIAKKIHERSLQGNQRQDRFVKCTLHRGFSGLFAISGVSGGASGRFVGGF